MNFVKQIERFQILNKLIHKQKTGSPEELANRLNLSRRQLYNYIEELKDLGMKVRYSRKHNSFYFDDSKKLEILFNIEVLETEENTKTIGGKYINYLPCFFSAQNWCNLAV
jgi:transcriptional antiterminator